MGFGEAIGAGYRNSFRLRGTATRPEYWFFVLFFFLLMASSFVLVGVVALYVKAVTAPVAAGAPADRPMLYAGFFFLAIALVPLFVAGLTLVPLFTAQVRRLHDAGQPGWWVLASLILQLLQALYQRVEKIDHTASVVMVHGVIVIAGFGINLVLLFFLVQPSARSGKYDVYY